MSNKVAWWLFGLAAAYNAVFGVWAALFPLSFFAVFDLPPPRYPSIWACVGMVVGLYGVVYAYVACQPERGDLFVWIGLAGKVLGPVGWLHAIWTGELPPRTFSLILANDLIWWFPFLFYLLRRSSWRRTIIAWISVAIHVGACVGLVAVSGGTELEPEMKARARWIAGHPAAWATTWFIWSLASMSLLAFMVAWAQRLAELSAGRQAVIAGCLICAAGLLFDLTGETTYIVKLTQTGISLDEFTRSAQAYTRLSVAAANGLYCLAGLRLSSLSGQSRFLRGWISGLGYVMWIVGLGLTFTAVIDYQFGQVITGAAVMGLFVTWEAWVGWRLRHTSTVGVPLHQREGHVDGEG